jgi:acyl transferase domain-containing protein
MTSQRDLIRSCLERARVEPRQIGYIEAHGTGTRIGDPIETGALGALWGRAAEPPCWIGSVKANIGHAEAAAGIAGLIKTALVLEHGSVPRQIHFAQLNPLISLDDTNLAIPMQTETWRGPEPRTAGVSSFGISGTNAFAVVQAAPDGTRRELPDVERTRHVLTLSGRSAAALEQLAGSMAAHLDRYPDRALPDVCFTANTGRTPFEYRAALCAGSREEMQRELRRLEGREPLLDGVRGIVPEAHQSCKMAFLFSGHGSQYFGMGRVLYRTQPVFQQNLDRCAELLRPFLKLELTGLLFADPTLSERLDEMSVAQPAVFALEYSLFRLWQAWGLEPDALIGHSLGELAAACAAGVFSLEDGMRLMAWRGRLMQERTRPGRMAAVRASEETALEVLAAFSQQVSIAGLNGPEQVAISGDSEALEQAVREFEKRGIKATMLNVQVAAHSPLMRTMLPEFAAIARSVRYSPPSIPLVSNVTGRVESEIFTSPDYWVRQVEAPVRFGDGLDALLENGIAAFVELGPHPVLSSLGRLADAEGRATWLTSLHRDQDDWTAMLHAAGRLFTLGVNLDWRAFDAPYPRSRLSLPHYPFARRRYWLEPGEAPPAAPPVSAREVPPPAKSRAPRSRVEEGVAKICAALIGAEDVDLGRSFFASGGDSLLATRLVARLRSEFHVNIALNHVLDARTMAQIAKTVEGLESAPAASKAPELKRLNRDRFLQAGTGQ